MAAYGVYYAAAAMAAVSYTQQERAEDKAYAAGRKSAEEQRKARAEQAAQNAAQAAAERRKQFREERIRRAKLIQSGINTGTQDSSGVLGGEANLASQRGAAVGANIGAIQAANNISIFNQNAMDAQGDISGFNQKAQMWGQIGNLSTNIALSGAVNSARTPSPYNNVADFTTPQNPGPMPQG